MSGTLRPIDVPRGQAVLDTLLPAIEGALDGSRAIAGAILPMPAGPEPVREALLSATRPDLPLERDDIAFVVPTSGSTGPPKGVLLSTRAVRASAAATEARLGGPGSWLLALPATHVAGLMVLARSVAAGTTPSAIDLTDGFNPSAFAAAFPGGERNYTSLVARQLAAILHEGGAALESLTRYDAVLLGGSAIPPDLLARARVAGATVVTTYGMTETCGGCVYDGIALDGVGVDLTDDGLVRISGDVVASGYRLSGPLETLGPRPGTPAERTFRPRPGTPATERSFTTADLGELDPAGRLTILGRRDDVAISGGVNVPLPAVEDAVTSHLGVQEAAAFARPDETWGQRIVVAIVSATDTPPSTNDIRTHVAELLPAAYVPKEIVVVDAIPTLPSGKTDRLSLLRQI